MLRVRCEHVVESIVGKLRIYVRRRLVAEELAWFDEKFKVALSISTDK